MDGITHYTAVLEQSAKREEERIDSLSDEKLRDLIGRAQGVLDARLQERRKTALAEIRRIARENGLDVSVRQKARRRGRPRKGDS